MERPSNDSVETVSNGGRVNQRKPSSKPVMASTVTSAAEGLHETYPVKERPEFANQQFIAYFQKDGYSLFLDLDSIEHLTHQGKEIVYCTFLERTSLMGSPKHSASYRYKTVAIDMESDVAFTWCVIDNWLYFDEDLSTYEHFDINEKKNWKSPYWTDESVEMVRWYIVTHRL